LRAGELAAELDGLRGRSVNYDEGEAPRSVDDPRWHVDTGYARLGVEPPGAPVADGPWEVACRLVAAYEFTDHRLLRGIYRPEHPLLGRDILLEGRFLALRFYLGVRVTELIDTQRHGPHGPERVWGWAYRTLDGHLEQGRLSYEVVKELDSGAVRFWIRAYSRRAPIPHPVIRLGFGMFGRNRQLSFYHRVGRRMHDLVQAHRDNSWQPEPTPVGHGVVVVPATARSRVWDAVAIRLRHPGR
jgi:uncharacterized protein (UPF0548 family)